MGGDWAGLQVDAPRASERAGKHEGPQYTDRHIFQRAVRLIMRVRTVL